MDDTKLDSIKNDLKSDSSLTDLEEYYKDKMEKPENNFGKIMTLLENQNKFDFEPVNDEQIFSNELDTIEKKSFIDQTDTENLSEKKEVNNLIFLLNIFNSCKNCGDCIFFKFQSFKRITIECICKLIKNCTVDEFINLFCKNNKPKQYGCKFHQRQKYEKYCIDCNRNLCKDCLDEEALYKIVTSAKKRHEDHTLIDLLNIDSKIKEAKELLQNNKNLDFDDKIKNIIQSLIDNYKEYPSYSGYKTIGKFSKKFGNKKEYDNDNDKDFKMEILIKINSIKLLEEKINCSNGIYKIQIKGQKTMDSLENLSIFEKHEFNKLKVLLLNGIGLKNINAFSQCSFPELKLLDLEVNELGDDCIEIFNKLNLPKIKLINLFDNKISSFQIFEVIRKYKDLKTFYIGKNPFSIEEIKIIQQNNKIIEISPQLDVLGLTNIFTNETNNFIPNNINIKNIKKLYISWNSFNSLKLFEKIYFSQLESFYLIGKDDKNYLTDINELKNLKVNESLKKINLKNQKIGNLKDLIEFIPSCFPGLKCLNLEKNGIEENEIKNVLMEIKKIKGFKKFEILY